MGDPIEVFGAVNGEVCSLGAPLWSSGVLAAVVENMRQILTFYKGELAVFTMTAKNDDIARTFWQSDGPAPYSDETIQPPC